MLGEILDDLLISASTGPCITASRHFPARPPVYAPFPATMDPRIVEALRARGIEQLYSHQARAWDLVQSGRHVVVVTPTASGKTLCYNLPVLQALVHQPDARALYGATPQFIMASATIANPGELAARLTGEDVDELAESGAPSGDKTFLCYNPPVVNPELGIRAPYLGETAKLAIRLLREQIATIVFAQSRLSTEVLLTAIKSGVADRATGDSGLVRGYRGGYLPNRRREVEQSLRAGDVLGVDIGHLDVAVLAGYPGTIASLWQQAGRAGRRSGPSAAILVATSAPLDQFMVTHPDYLFGTPPEHARVNPDNPFILANHLKCAAFELPLVADEPFGQTDVRKLAAALEDEGLLHRAGERYHWASETYPADHISLRTVTTDNFVVIDTTHRDEQQTKKRNIIAEVDWGSAFATIYPKAIYLVESVPYEVQELRFREDEEKVAYVKRVNVDYFTDAVSAKGVWILQRFEGREQPGYVAEQGEVLVAEKVVGFKKIKLGTMENVGSGNVDLPQQEMHTTSAWLTVAPATLARVSRSREELIDGLRAVTYLLHHLAPIFLLCDVRDLGSWLGDTTPAETGAVATRESTKARLMNAAEFNPTIYLYDSHAGGIGLAERVFEILPDLLRRGLETLAACPCAFGCPSCVGPVNEVGRRAKATAAKLLRELTA